MSVAYFIDQMTPVVPQVGGGTGGGNPQMTYTLVSYCDGLVYENDTLKQVLIDGGYVTFNGSSPQYHTAIKNARTLSNELNDNELTFVGHSLGGGEAIASSMATGRAAITFNPAAVSGLTKFTEGLDKTPNVVNYRAIGEKISIGNIRIGGDMLNNLQEKVGLSLPGKTIGIPTGLMPTHSVGDFLHSNILDPL